MRAQGKKLTGTQRKLLIEAGIPEEELRQYLLISIANGKRTAGGGERNRMDVYTLRDKVSNEEKQIEVQMTY